MKTLKTILTAALAALAITACDNEADETFQTPEQSEIQLLMIHPNEQTRATDTAFEKSDSIGVYVTDSNTALQLGGNEVNNELFTYNGSSWTSKRKVYWNDGTHNVYAYFPQSKQVNDVKDFNFSVQENQNSTWGYSHSDFLWATASNITASSSPVKMKFAHKMSNVVIKLEKGENFEGNIPSNAEVYIYSTVTKANIDLSTGDVAKDNYAGSSTIRCRKISDTEYRAIVVPQSINSRRPLVEIIIGDVSYLMEGKISFKPGYRHTITVTLDKNPEKIKIDVGGEIVNW